MKFKSLVIACAFTFSVFVSPASSAATSELSMTVKQTPNAIEPRVTLYGTLKPNKSGTTVTIEMEKNGAWNATKFTTQVTRAGTWKVIKPATSFESKVRYRAVVLVNKKNIQSPMRTIALEKTDDPGVSDPALFIDLVGPGGRIHGADVSRWQHPNDAKIDFVKMYENGLRFVFIKASDTTEKGDALALKYAAMDHNAAQAAGIYTGFYHYAYLPDVTDEEGIKRDALAQAQKVVWRLASLGGYGEKDLPYALDLENKCVRYSASGTCLKNATRTAVTLWATTFLASLKEKTGKTPILYSYANFLEGSMNRTKELAQYPLWLAHYGIDPAKPGNQPGVKAGGCFVHSWTSKNCESQWTLWQYSSCGIAPKYGVPGSRLDLNVFSGSQRSFLDLVKGIWTPTLDELMPKQEPSNMLLTAQAASSSDKAVSFKVNVTRPTSLPVVTGSVKLVFDAATKPSPAPTQRLIRETSGVWTLSVKGVPAGNYSGKLLYEDVSGTHADATVPVNFVVAQGPEPTPSPSPTPSPTKKPTTDSCKGQIRN
jgi:GH25 family lysozyme M1 (1,4-beta-N-acetylmuramidase)